MTIGERIALERKRRNWSQALLAEEAGLTQGGLATVEQKNSNTTCNTLVKIAKAFDISTDDLLKGCDNHDPTTARKEPPCATR